MTAQALPTKNQQRTAQRRQDIVATAWRLISERGYDATSLNTIITELGISKGSVYHHFQSKAAVLDAVVETLTTEVRQRVAADNADADALHRLCAFIRSGWEWHEEHEGLSTEILRVMLRPENAELLAQINATERRVFRPLLEDIISQGIREQVFDLPDAELATDFLLPILTDALVRIVREIPGGQLDAEGFLAQLRFLQSAVERILGAPEDSLRYAFPPCALSLAEVSAFIEHFTDGRPT